MVGIRIGCTEKSKNAKDMATKESGYVYILTNPGFREDWGEDWQEHDPQLRGC